ncbi:MAG: hypothetical protein ACM3Q2_12400, partial [Syntrophothermus sp.]
MIARIAVLSFYFITGISLFAQLSRDDVKEILIIQGMTDSASIESEADEAYTSYITRTSFNTSDLSSAVLSSMGAGAAEGLFQSRTASYKNIKWLPGFMRDWYNYLPADEAVFARFDTWQKNFREADYLLDRPAYNSWNRYFGGAWYLSYPAHWALKSLSASLVRHKMKYGNFF